MEAGKDIVVLIHGIRDFAAWQVTIRSELASHGLAVELTNYERFDLIRFLIPIGKFRNVIVERIWEQIQQIQQIHPDARLSFIAHSFGTFVLAEILRTKFTFKAARVIFCGSIVRYDFPFQQINNRFFSPIVSEVGSRDIWPALAASVTFGYGSSGTYGFRRPHVRDRWHNGARHSDFLTSEFCRKYWVPLLTKAEFVDGDSQPEAPAWWIRLTTIFPIKYAVIAALIAPLTVLPSIYDRYKSRSISEWVATVATARNNGTLHDSRPIPSEVVDKRTQFESWWENAGLETRRKVSADLVYKALSQNVRLYRMAEIQSEAKPNANYWIEQCLGHFEQRQNTRYVTECLLERAALFLELSQIGHTDAEKFQKIAREGDAVMARAASLANEAQQPEVYRIWSRFYYNLARPRDGLLSSNWSNNYLSLAYDKAKAAHELDTKDIKNVTQLSRVTQKYAANPPQDSNPAWTSELRRVQELMISTFRLRDKALNSPRARIPPLNILAVLTMDVVRREWKEEKFGSKFAAIRAVKELEDVAIASQREAWALVEHTEWVKEYRYDLNYDLARIQAVLIQVVQSIDEVVAESTFSELIENMKRAVGGASHNQIKAALASVDKDPNIAGLSMQRRDRIRTIFTIQ